MPVQAKTKKHKPTHPETQPKEVVETSRTQLETIGCWLGFVIRHIQGRSVIHRAAYFHMSCGEKFANARDLAFFVDEAATFMKERLPLVPGDLPFMAVMKLKEGLS
ncbi:hypothetical protein ACCO45_010010 [Purpureocillium lilacinum]|uniref:Uncharacterized protein n=1 Tax=Purpureocillium lilacinum TaxID=33203 RepID=A0ACC4DEC7_PURLI